MKKIFYYGPVCILLVLIFCGTADAQTNVFFKMPLPDSLQKVLLDVTELYGKMYGLPDTITVLDGKDIVYHRNDGIENVLALGYHKKIKITPRGLESNVKNFRSMIAHEFFHVWKPDTLCRDITFQFHDGKVFLGSIGLSIRIKYRTKDDTLFFGKIEEGAAEACALRCLPGYNTRHPGYQILGMFTNVMINRGWVSAKDLIAMVKSPQGLTLFIAKILDIDQCNVGEKEIVYFMVLYSDLFDDKDYKPYINELKRMRMLYEYMYPR